MSRTIEPAAPEIVIPIRRAAPLWSEERKDRAIELWKAGQSASQIARDLGGGLSRNAVIGKLHRHGYRRGDNPRVLGLRPSTTSRRGATRFYRPRSSLGIAATPGLATDLAPEPAANPVGIFELEPDHCRWPIGGVGHQTMFCGDLAAERLPYCPHHCAIAYRTLAEVRAETRRYVRQQGASPNFKFGSAKK